METFLKIRIFMLCLSRVIIGVLNIMCFNATAFGINGVALSLLYDDSMQLGWAIPPHLNPLPSQSTGSWLHITLHWRRMVELYLLLHGFQGCKPSIRNCPIGHEGSTS